MVLPKIAFLRGGLVKTFAHAPQSFVLGTQSSFPTSQFAPFGPHAHGKFGKANAHLHTSFQGPSSPAAVQGRAAYASEKDGDKNENGLTAYYDAWQKQHEPGTEQKEWKQFQFTKQIGWEAPTAAVLAGRAKEREELGLRPEARLEPGLLDRAYSTSAVDDFKRPENATAEAEALASIDEAIAKTINEIRSSRDVELHNAPQVLTSSDVSHGSAASVLELSASRATPSIDSKAASAFSNSSLPSIETATTPEPVTEAFSNQIATLKQAGRYGEIPPLFELMLAEGVRPTIEAYNGLLASVAHMPMGKHQRIPRALDIYTSMLSLKVTPDAEFYNSLVQLLADRALYVSSTMKSMDQQRTRFDGLTSDSRSLFRSKDAEYDILSEDEAFTTAIKVFDQAVRAGQDHFSSEMYRSLVIACAFHGELDQMLRIYSRMELHKVVPIATMFPPMIEAFGACGDLASLVVLYDGYKTLAVSNDTGKSAMQGRQDNDVYTAVIKAYARWGRLAGGEKFLGKIMQSYVPGTENRQAKIEATQDAVHVHAFIQQRLDAGDFHDALRIAQEAVLTPQARDEAYVKISMAAADSNIADLASTAYGHINEANTVKLEAAVVMLGLHIRRDDMKLARGVWSDIMGSSATDASFVEPAASYATSLVKNGLVDEALVQSREAFARVRASATGRFDAVEEIDEAIEVIGASVLKQGIIPSGPAAVSFLRAMVENRGLVSPVAEQMMSGLGYEEILSLSLQDLTLTLQVQADMLAHGAPLLDIGHTERFAHLVSLVTTSRVAPDHQMSERVERAAHHLASSRPDILAQWHSYQQSLLTPPMTPLSYTPQPMTPAPTPGNFADSFDPYAATTDVRGSNIIADELDNHRSGTLAALNEAVARLHNMRRVGRHPRYIVYSKLITAAAKEKRSDIIRDVHAIAEHDVTLMAQYPTVRHGWTLILDAMVGACLTVGKRALAGRFHQELLSIGSAPSANTFGLYITTLKESTKTFDEASEAVRIFQQAQSQGAEPSSFLYNALIGKLGKARRIDDCLHHFTQMRNLGIRPTSVTYGTIVNACCRVSDERMAEQLFDEMEAQSNYKPRPAPYNSLMQFFLTTKRDSKKVLAYYERMRSLNIQPTMHTYKLLIDTYATLEPVNLAAAEGVLQTIRASGQKPEAVHYSSLIHAKGCNLKDMEGAKALFDRVINNREVVPQACLYQALFESMVANHNVTASGPVLADMAAHGIAMTPYIANTLIHGWANEKSLVNALAVYESIDTTKREPSTYEAMTRAYLTNGHRAGAIEVVNEMKAKRYPGAVENKVLDLLGPNASQAENIYPVSYHMAPNGAAEAVLA